MERLEQYCMGVCDIDGLQTFIISSSKYEELLKDSELLKHLKISEKLMTPFIRTIRELNTDKIYFTFVYLPTFIEKFQWMPVYCYKSGSQFYHVHYKDSWLCHECGNIMNQPVIMPLVEVDPGIYSHSARGNRHPMIPPFSQKIKCPKCGKPLQNHLFLIK